MTETLDAREAAVTRLKEKRDFWMHCFVYFAINAFLVMVWWMTNRPGYFWPVWVIGGWGIGLGAHAVETFMPISEAAVRKEMERQGRA